MPTPPPPPAAATLSRTRDSTRAADAVTTRCCIVGGGPAGLMTGLLLARAGVDVVVLEKHDDFLRDFRGDTIHPSTLDVMHELGLLGDLLARPHQKARSLDLVIEDRAFTVVDFGYLPTRCKFIAFMPQWDFLDLLAGRGRDYPGFRLMMRTEASGLVERNGRVAGVTAQGPDGPVEISCDLVIGADGRGSTVRAAAGLESEDLGAPMDVLWFKISRTPAHPEQFMARFSGGRIFIMLNRGDYWQCGFVIAKGSRDAITSAGLDALREEIVRLAPFLDDAVGDIASWDDVKQLTVRVDRLKTWHRPGLLCIGDAAHAMSPVGGVGINLAIQDAVAAANILAAPLAAGTLSEADLQRVQARRWWPTWATQRLQLAVQKRIVTPVLGETGRLSAPLAVRLADRVALLRALPAWVIGKGVRAEHVAVREATGRGGAMSGEQRT